MKLSFNFTIRNFQGIDAGPAKHTIIRILENGNSNDRNYLKKISDWQKQLTKNGVIEDIDRTDAEVLKNIVLNCPITFNFAKIALMDFLEERIKEATPNDSKDKNKDKSKNK